MGLRYDILDGPTLNGLNNSLIQGSGQKRLTVSFTLEDFSQCLKIPLELVINSLGRESGDGWNWLIEGYSTGQMAGSWQGYYSTKTGRGWIQRVP